MQAKRAYRDRERTQVAVLDALVDRAEEGMTVFELRTAVDVDIDIDDIEAALAELKQAGLITVENEEGPMRIYPHDRVVPDPEADADEETGSILEKIRDRIGL